MYGLIWVCNMTKIKNKKSTNWGSNVGIESKKKTRSFREEVDFIDLSITFQLNPSGILSV